MRIPIISISVDYVLNYILKIYISFIRFLRNYKTEAEHNKSLFNYTKVNSYTKVIDIGDACGGDPKLLNFPDSHKYQPRQWYPPAIFGVFVFGRQILTSNRNTLDDDDDVLGVYYVFYLK